MRMTFLALAVGAAALFDAVLAQAGPGSSDTRTEQSFFTDRGLAEFTSSVPLHEFTGISERLVGRISLTDSTVDFYLDLETLETGIGKRDKDMKRTLETDEYPFAEFFGKLISPFDPRRSDAQHAVARGDFSIHGVTRPVAIMGTIRLDSLGLHIEADWELNLEDYDIEPPSLLIVRVDEIQKLHIKATLRPEE
jgi:polyisoprenoid-binding protein YceI